MSKKYALYMEKLLRQLGAYARSISLATNTARVNRASDKCSLAIKVSPTGVTTLTGQLGVFDLSAHWNGRNKLSYYGVSNRPGQNKLELTEKQICDLFNLLARTFHPDYKSATPFERRATLRPVMANDKLQYR